MFFQNILFLKVWDIFIVNAPWAAFTMLQIVREDNLSYWVFDMCSFEIKENSTSIQGYTQIMELK